MKSLSAGVASVAISPAGPVGTLRRLSRERADPGELPPRVVALRTEGGNFRFDPVGLRLDTGESLVWLNMGDFHTATAFHPDHSHLLGRDVPLRIPEGADPFHSGMLGLTGGTEFEHRFAVPGVYDYFCQPHYSFGMVGRLIVGDGSEADPRPPAELNEASRDQMPSMETVLGARGRTFEWASRLNGLLWLRSHREPTDAAFRAVEEGVAGDDALQEVLGPGAGEVEARVSELGEALSAGADYESLVRRADRAKDLLRRETGRGN